MTTHALKQLLRYHSDLNLKQLQIPKPYSDQFAPPPYTVQHITKASFDQFLSKFAERKSPYTRRQKRSAPSTAPVTRHEISEGILAERKSLLVPVASARKSSGAAAFVRQLKVGRVNFRARNFRKRSFLEQSRRMGSVNLNVVSVIVVALIMACAVCVSASGIGSIFADENPIRQVVSNGLWELETAVLQVIGQNGSIDV
ncbi:hypothetical protein HanPI659440_Chr16g0648681 [Helianthus annuus]|nr:hypothetical protein HanPI659440_Chr16g0648681 [Helianthus annuus]